MGRINNSINTFNMTLRTLLATVFVGGLGVGGWFGYSKFNEAELKDKMLEETRKDLIKIQTQLDQTNQQLVATEHERDVLSASLRLMKFNHRVAQLRVKNMIPGRGAGETTSEIEFVELTSSGDPIGKPVTFTMKGDLVYIDYWVVKFDDKYIETAEDLDRSTSLCLFRRIFGEFQQPIEGFQLDREHTQPLSYARGGKLSPLEEKIWSDFWSVANDVDKQEGLGIRAAHGEAVSIKVLKGRTYRLQLRASDGLSIVLEQDDVKTHDPSA